MNENQLTVAEQPQQLITIEPAKYVDLVFEPFAKRLADAKTLAKAAVFDVTTTAGMAVAVKHRATFREIRVESEKARKVRKAPILEIGKLLDSRQKEIEAEIEPFESRFDDAIKAEEARKEAEKAAKAAAEKERVDGIKARIEAFMLDAMTASDGTAAEIDAHATRLSETVIDLEGWQEFSGEAQLKRDNTVKWLRERQQQAAEREAEAARLAAEREALERERAAQAERDRIAAAEREAQAKKDREELAARQAAIAEQERKVAAARAQEEARLKAQREAEEARLRAQREAEEQRLAEQRAELARQQAEIDRQRAEQERKELEAREAAEAAARAEAERIAAEEAAAAQAEIDRAFEEAQRQEEQRHAAEMERLQRELDEFAKHGPGDVEMVKVLAEHYDVTVGDVMQWMKKFDYSAADEQLAAENVAANRLEKAA